MNVILTAGGISRPKDALYPFTGGGYKAMLDINGKPMIQYVLDALNACDSIEKIIMVGLPADNLLDSAKLLASLEDHGDMVANILAGARELTRLYPGETNALIVSSDIPSVTSRMIDWVIARVQESTDEIFYNVIERKVMEARFPSSRRTYVRLKNMDVCGGDLNAVRLSIASDENPLWDRLIEARKSPLHQAALIGYDTLFLLLLGRLSLEEAAAAVSRRMGIRARAILCPFAELGMDVDKPFQLEILRKDLVHQNG